MNIKQRVVLIIGGIILVIALITTPQYQIIDGTKFMANTSPHIANQFDLNNAIIRTTILIALVLPIYFAFKSKD